jgi:hypothetical protein
MHPRHPRFESLAHAVRAGIQLVPDAAPPRRYLGVSAATGHLGCDALAAAWLAEYYDGERSSEDEHGGLDRFLSASLAGAYPALRTELGNDCPAGPDDRCPAPLRAGRTLEAKLMHLQDEHTMSRVEIADWLEDNGY